MAVPKLRFRADDGSEFPEWEEKKLEVFFDFFKAAVLSKEDIKETGKRPCIHYGQLFTRYDEVVRTVGFYSDKDGFLSKSGDILMPSSDVTPSGLAKASALMLDNVLLGGDINVLRSKKEVSSEFFAYIINFFKKKILVKVTGSSIKHIYIENIKNITYRIPSLPEQKKIADFLSAIDKEIGYISEKRDLLEQYKKSVMQKIFDREIRFRADDGSEFPKWEKTALGEICTIEGGGTPVTNIAKYWNGDIQWFTPSEVGKEKYISRSQRTITELGLKNSSAKLLPPGTVLLSTRATLGEMSISKMACTTNQGFQSLIPNNKTISEFLYYQQRQIKYWCYRNACGSTFLEIGKSSLAVCTIHLPSVPEQKKIADFLSAIDEKIDLTEKQLSALNQYKKGLMQQLFV